MVPKAVARSGQIPFALILSLTFILGGCTGKTKAEDELQDPIADNPLDQSGDTSGQTPPAPSGDTPTVSLSSDQLTVNEGGSVTLSWSTSGADSCAASGGWGGTLATSGSQTVGPLTSGTTFSLSCTGSGGSALQMISVAVVGPVSLAWVAPDQNVDGSPLTDLAGYRIYYGDSSRAYSEMVELASPSATSHTLNLASGDYYVAMTALDAEGNESGYSNEVVKTRL